MNKVVMTGRLVADPTVHSNGNVVVRYRMAVDRRFKREGQPEADFFECVVFGKSAEFAQKYFVKGTKILIEGEVHNTEWTNREGQKMYGTEIVVESQEFAESKRD